jgi:pimeloyl-ACP methyl ester carboxylesterase
MALDMLKAGRMALYAADAECLFDTLADGDHHGCPVLPADFGKKFGLLQASDWEIVGQIRCNDDLRIIQFLKRHLDIGQNNFFYGFLLRRASRPNADFAVGDYLAMVRGTIEKIEWLLDATATADGFSPQPHHIAGVVPSGFYSIYKSMTLRDLTGRELGDAATAIGNAANQENRPVTVVGHSLGSALATYLTFDLANEVHDPANNLHSFVVASPNPGDLAFDKKFRERVPRYNVVNWSRDLVPRVPPPPFFALLNGSPDQNVVMVSASTPGLGPVPHNDPKCNHHAACYALMLNPAEAAASRVVTGSFADCVDVAALTASGIGAAAAGIPAQPAGPTTPIELHTPDH